MADRGQLICEQLKLCGVEYIVWLPDSESFFMHEAMQSDPDLQIIQCCSEGEAISILAGLHLGGKRGIVLIENNGLFEAGNALRWVSDSRFPLVMLVGYLRYRFMTRTAEGMMWNDDYWPGIKDLTEPFIEAFDVPYHLLATDEDTKVIPEAFAEAERRAGPVILLTVSADDFMPGTK